jgi:hypothetical protein
MINVKYIVIKTQTKPDKLTRSHCYYDTFWTTVILVTRSLIHFSLKHVCIVARSVKILLCLIGEGLIVACRKCRSDVTESISLHTDTLQLACLAHGAVPWGHYVCVQSVHAWLVMFVCFHLPHCNYVMSRIITKQCPVNSLRANTNQIAHLVFTAGICNKACQWADPGSRLVQRNSAPTL